ncbi:MAG TPA: M28 family peptidase [Coriobacteriia bacterium]|nr:M28 family peptidase [Coriobacteriia bacterium]
MRIDSRRIPTTAEHVIATLPGTGAGRIVVSAHIDSREGAPGALDNASGVAVLMATTELLGGYSGGPSIEFVPFNGEDNYANPGEMLWYAENRDRCDDIVLAISIDDLGMCRTTNHVSFYGCSPEVRDTVLKVATRYPSVSGGPQWFQGDHAIFAQMGVPAIAMASSGMLEFMAKYAHSERDTVEIPDAALLAEAARFLDEVIRAVAVLVA